MCHDRAMRRRDLLKSAGVVAWAGRMKAAPARRPNVLLLLAGAWRAQTLPTSGAAELEAPSLLRLAREGVQFNRAYTSYPLGTPSRGALMTGRFPHASGVRSNDVQLAVDQPTLSQ